MKTTNLIPITGSAILAQVHLCRAASADVDPAETEKIGANTEISVIAPNRRTELQVLNKEMLKEYNP